MRLADVAKGALPPSRILRDALIPRSFSAKMKGGAVALSCFAGALNAQGVGEMARACMADGGAPGPCFGEETAIWEGRVAQATGALHASGSMEDRNSGGLEPFAQMGPRLDRAQGAFEAYRDAMCDFVSVGWPGTSDAGAAWAECRMVVTATHAQRLQSVLEVFE